MKKNNNIVGYLGMIILQGNNMPNILAEHLLMPIYSPIMAMIGLSIYLYYSILRCDKVYIISNSIGIILSIIIIARLIWLK